MEYRSGLIRAIQACLLCASCLFMMTSNAYAGGNDFDLTRLCTTANGCQEAGAHDDFKGLMRTYGSLFAPMHLNPASTIGQEGFEIAASTKISFATEDAPFWKATNSNLNKTADDKGNYAAPDVFATIDLSMRKGLPFSLEVEGDVSWLANSSMFYIGAGLRWAITEGWWFLPDISVRGHVGTVVGESQINMINVNVDAAISYTWGLGGIVAFTPYAGYSALINVSSSHPVVLYRKNAKGEMTTQEDVFGQVTQTVNRGFVGVQLKGEYFIFDASGEFGKGVSSLGLKIGALF